MKKFASPREKAKYFKSLTESEKYQAFREIVEESEHTVFLGGAGVSTGSGVPDFRSRNGLYRKSGTFSRARGAGPEYMLSHDCLEQEPEAFFAYVRKNLDCRAAVPNQAHLILAQMERMGLLDGIVTQNIDGLHQKAGSRNVQEIHGSLMRSYCVSCRHEYGPDYIFDSRQSVPLCPVCHRMVRPDVTLYGEILPSPAYENAIDLITHAQTLIVGGTSLAVGSASSLVHLFHGDYLIMINLDKTKMEGAADLVFHTRIEKALERLIAKA